MELRIRFDYSSLTQSNQARWQQMILAIRQMPGVLAIDMEQEPEIDRYPNPSRVVSGNRRRNPVQADEYDAASAFPPSLPHEVLAQDRPVRRTPASLIDITE